MMIKRSLLAASIAALSAQMAYAAPFMPLDARGMAMGNTGVATAQHASAASYNPSLLSQTYGRDHFHILLPQVGVLLSDEREVIDNAQTIADDVIPQFDDALNGIGGNGGLTDHLEDLEQAINTFNTKIAEFETAANNVNSSDSATITAATTKLTEVQNANSDLSSKIGIVRGDVGLVDTATKNLTSSMDNISGNPLTARLNVNPISIAVPGKTLGVAVTTQGTVGVSLRMHFKDAALMNAYAPAVDEYLAATQNTSDALGAILNTDLSGSDAQKATALNQLKNDLSGGAGQALRDDFTNGFTSTSQNHYNGSPVFKNGEFSDEMSDPSLQSSVEAVAVAIVDVGISLSHEFDIMGEAIAIGVTPKIQRVSTFHYAASADGFDEVNEDDLKNQQKDYNKINLDVGASYRFGANNNWTAGLVVKNLFGGKFKYEDVKVKDENGLETGEVIAGGNVHLDPQMRAGIAYNASFFGIGNYTLTSDLDLLKNKPLAYESATQYAAFGGELSLFRTLQLRAGYRMNLQESDQSVISAGVGLSPFGLHIDLAAFANPSDVKKEAGAVLQTGFKF